jgi:PAS domain S-box-containing protein
MADEMNGGRERAYQALRESEELHRAALSSISDAVFLTDDAGAFTFICPNVDVIFGYLPDEVQSMSRIDRLLGSDLFDAAELSAKGEIRNMEREITAKSGERRTVLIHFKRVSIKGGTVLYTCRDVTELKLAESELGATRLKLDHVARLALAGQLMASIVDEIKEPLSFVRHDLSAGLRILDDQNKTAHLDELREILEDIRLGNDEVSEIVDRLATLVQKRPLELRLIDLNEVVSDVLHLVRADAASRGVKLRTELANPLPPVTADRVSVMHLLLDLIVNAMDAMDHNEDERLIVVRTNHGPESVEIAVGDTGHGIPPENRAKLFSAFFTTKTDRVGLGLVMARSIAEAHGGRIWAEDQSGRGTTFRVALPLRSSS